MRKLTAMLLLGAAFFGAHTAARAEGLNIAFTHHSSASNTFWQAVKKGFDDACAKVEANCNMIFTQTEGSIEQQVANMRAALASKPDALLTSIVDDHALDDVIKEALDAGVQVIAVNVDDTEGAKGNARQAFVGQGFKPAGYSLAKAISESFPKDGPILVITDTFCEDSLRIRRAHAFLVPRGRRLPFPPRGPVFYLR